MKIREYMQKHILDRYYENEIIEMDELKQIIKIAIPIFGELEIEIKDDEDSNGSKIYFYDIDEITTVLRPNEDGELIEVELSKEESEKVSSKSVIASIYTNDKNEIVFIDCGNNGFFTTANKDMVLAVGGLIGKVLKIKKNK